MAILQSLPTRGLALETDNLDELAEIQPERNRSVVQLERGALRFKLQELVWGEAGIHTEQWTCGIRMQLGRPSSYVSFSFITQARAHWMGVPIGPGSVLRIVGPWECVSRGPVEHVTLVVSQRAFESAAALVRDPDGEHGAPSENHASRRSDGVLLAMRLLRDLQALQRQASHSAALAAAEEELLRLALVLDRPPGGTPVERLSSSPARRMAIRRVEAYLEANSESIPSIPMLCQVAEVSERTLEYAFREHLGVTPVRYLKLRRLMLARRRLQNPIPGVDSVTDIVGGCGIYELGRFAGEYRKHFGELPSETLRRRIAP